MAGRRVWNVWLPLVISLSSGAAFLALALLVRFSRTMRADRFADRVAERLDHPLVQGVGQLLTDLGRVEFTLFLPLVLAAALWWLANRELALRRR